MYKYDGDKNRLAIRKIEVTAPDIDLYEDIRNSYSLFLQSSIHKCVAKFEELLQGVLDNKEVTVRAIVEDVVSTGSKREIKRGGSKYYPVRICVNTGGNLKETEFIRIPYMDELGVLNVEGSLRVVLNYIRSANNISWDDVKSALTVVLPERSLKLQVGKNDIRIKSGKDLKPIESILYSYMFYTNEFYDLSTYFSNQYVVNSFSHRDYQMDWKMEDEASKTTFYKLYHSPNYALGDLRGVLNVRLSIDSCIFQTLARAVFLDRDGETIPAGTYVDTDILKKLKYNLVNEVYIRHIPEITMAYLAEDISISVIPQGTKVTRYMRNLLPDATLGNFIQEDMSLKKPLILHSGIIITSEVLEFLFDCGYQHVMYATNKQLSGIKTLRFEQDIIGNNFHKVGDFIETEAIPEGLSYDDYIYVYDIDTDYNVVTNTPQDYFTLYDLLSLISLTGRCITMPELREIFNRDIEFIKKIDMVNETFTFYLNKAIEEYVKQFKRKLLTDYSSYSSSTHEFFSLSKMWYRHMWDSKLLRVVEDTNPISILTQVRRVTYVAGSVERYPLEVRDVAMGQYGKICPYETPEGKNIGLVNSLAYGCKIVNGIPKTPYYKVKLKSGKAQLITSRVHYLSSVEELDYKITDICSLQFDAKGNFANTRVVAKVPSFERSGGRTKFDTIYANTLDYVTVYPEQLMSPTAQLVPFASNDGAVRVSFALSRIRQALNIMGSEAPIVMTSMYEKMFDRNKDYCIRAAADGEVFDIIHDKLYLKYDEKDELEEIEVPEVRVSDHSIITLSYVIPKGARFRKGDVIVDSTLARNGAFSPGTNLLYGIVIHDGYNYEDAVVVSEQAQQKLVSVTSDTIEEVITDSDSLIFDNKVGQKYKYVTEGDTIATISQSSARDGRTKREIEIKAKGKSGIIYDIRRVYDNKDLKFVVKMMCFKRLGPGDKLSGRHANKGCNSHVVKTSEMPRLMNGVPIEISVNPAGINSRMNTGQIQEGLLGLVGMLLDIQIESNSFNGATQEDISKLMHFVWLIANDSAEAASREHSDLPQALLNRAYERESYIKEFEGCFDERGLAQLYNPVTGTMFEYKVAIGVTYMLKLVQEVDEKMHARSYAVEENYSYLNKQPPKGSSAGGGQTFGEMELAAILAHGAMEVAHEMVNVKSDNTEDRFNLVLRSLNLDEMTNNELRADIIELLSSEGVNNPHSVHMLRYFLEALGYNLYGEELADLSYRAISAKVEPEISKIFSAFTEEGAYVSSSTKRELFAGIEDV